MIVECFAGPGGWSEGLALLGRDAIGIEWDADACTTARAAGHARIRADVARYPVAALRGVEGLIMSPPCPTFSNAGAGAGRLVMDELAAAIRDVAAGGDLDAHRATIESRLFRSAVDQDMSIADAGIYAEQTAREAMLTCEPIRWAAELHPRWVACEQVPPVLPLWEATCYALEQLGYRTWCGILNAADYGVPQTRRRAFLLASLDRQPHPPEPTHGQSPEATLFGPERRPWVSMAQALSWMSPSDVWRWNNSESERSRGASFHQERSGEEPAPTLAFGHSRPMVRPTEEPSSRWRAEWWRRQIAAGEITAVGFPRVDDRGDSDDGYRERDWHPLEEPSAVVTEKARSWTVKAGGQDRATARTLDEPAPTVAFGHDWGSWELVPPDLDAETLAALEQRNADIESLVVRTGANSMVTGRTAADVQPYERSVTEPAPTVDAKTGSAWTVRSNNTVAGEGRAERSTDEPAFTVTSRADLWEVGEMPTSQPDDLAQLATAAELDGLVVNTGRDWKAGGSRDDAQRIPVTDPAPTLDGKGRWFLERPATTLQGDPRVWPPGHKVNADDEARLGVEEAAERYGDRAGTRAIRIEIADALVLQSFPPDYPVHGTKSSQFRQVGNAVPPLLAAHVLTQVLPE